MRIWNKRFKEKGIELVLLRKNANTALIYVYRKSRLQAELKKPGVERFLNTYGYTGTEADDALLKLAERLSEGSGFPHEIGVFLGYPLGDVIGFIRNAGQNYKCTGCWKVYCDEHEAQKTFARFKNAEDVYTRLWNQGRSVLQLTVAA